MGLSQLLDEIYFWNFLETLLGCFHTNSKYFWIFCMSVILLVGYFLTEIRQIWGYLHFWMRYLSETFLGHWFTGFLLCLAELTYWLMSFCVLVLTLKPLVLLTFGSLRISFWDLWSCSSSTIVLSLCELPKQEISFTHTHTKWKI